MSPRPARRGRNRQGQNRLRASQVRLDRLFYVGYLKQGDILCVNMDDIIYDFTIVNQRNLTLRMPNGQEMRLSRGGGPFSILVAAGLAVSAQVNRGIWDYFLVFREGESLGTLNEIRERFWNASERNRLWAAGRAEAAST